MALALSTRSSSSFFQLIMTGYPAATKDAAASGSGSVGLQCAGDQCMEVKGIGYQGAGVVVRGAGEEGESMAAEVSERRLGGT